MSFLSAAKNLCLLAGGLFLLIHAAGCGLLPGGPGSCDDPLWNAGKGESSPVVRLDRDRAAPLYVVRLDMDGDVCKAQNADAVLAAIKETSPTHIYIVCPGWAGNYAEATGWTASFLSGFEAMRHRASADPAHPREYRPLYVAVLWPSDVLIDQFPAPSSEGHRRPVRADVDTQALTDTLGIDTQPPRMARIKQALKAQGHVVRATQLDHLVAKAADLTPPELVDFANCLLPLYGPQEEPWVPGPRFAETLGAKPIGRIRESEFVGILSQGPAPTAPIDPQELLEVWKRSVREAAGDLKHEMDKPGDDASRARVGGLRVVELVRWALKATDLRLMKDRAYRAGIGGVRDLLDSIDAARGNAPVHLVGHSLGCEALLAALSRSEPAAAAPTTQPAAPRALADTLLLLQPMVSSWAFSAPPQVAPDVVPGLQKYSRPGEYRLAVTSAVRGPIVMTHSARDWVESYYAPKAIRRSQLEGEANPDTWAGDGNTFKIMGGAGLLGTDPPVAQVALIPITSSTPTQRYDFSNEAGKLFAVDASTAILAHGDVNEPSLWWLLVNEVK